MKCQGCGHDYPNTISRCPRCRLSSRRGSTSSDSRLIEFPRKARAISQSEPAEASLPAWRVELNERVRAIKAKRGGGPESETLSASVAESDDIERNAVNVRQDETRSKVRPSPGREVATLAAEAVRGEFDQTGSSYQPARAARSTGRANTSIVEAALTRVRKASENASRAALPKIEPVRAAQPGAKSSLALDREATARVLEPATEIKPRPAPKTISLPEISRPPVERPAPVEFVPSVSTPPVTEKAGSKHSADPLDSPLPTVTHSTESPKTIVLDEMEAMDYLEAEVRKVDQVLSKEFAKNDSPSLVTHLVLNVVDLLTIAVSCSPFLAIILITNGTLASLQTRVAMGGIIALVAFLYLSLTQSLCGKTFGMMFTGTRILDDQTSEAPSAQRALLRTAGYFIAAAPALLGLLWAAGNRKRRGWQDFIAGTFVAHDF